MACPCGVSTSRNSFVPFSSYRVNFLGCVVRHTAAFSLKDEKLSKKSKRAVCDSKRMAMIPDLADIEYLSISNTYVNLGWVGSIVG